MNLECCPNIDLLKKYVSDQAKIFFLTDDKKMYVW